MFLLLAAFAAWALHSGALQVPDRWNPWAPLHIAEAPNFLTRYKLSRASIDRDACQAALAPPRLDHLTLGELEARIRAGHPGFPEPAIDAFLRCFRVRPDGTVTPRLARERHLRILRALWEHRPSTRWATLGVPALLLLADTGDPAYTADKRRAAAVARAAAPNLRVEWFAPAHHDLHAHVQVFDHLLQPAHLTLDPPQPLEVRRFEFRLHGLGVFHSVAPLNRRLFDTTLTELKAMAALAMIGLSRMPATG